MAAAIGKSRPDLREIIATPPFLAGFRLRRAPAIT
jgi:hypothetical protein